VVQEKPYRLSVALLLDHKELVQDANPHFIVPSKTTLAQSNWGPCGVTFTLPATSISFTGLSAYQKRLIEENYAGFISKQPNTQDKQQASCHVYKMEQPPEVSLADLTRDGQYAPLQRRRASSVDLTGNEFRASVPIAEHASLGSLGVVHEEQLPYPSVIENVLRVYTAYKAVETRGVILHSAGLVFDQQAYIFVGRSNAGKTTLTRKAHAYGAKVLSDDINMVLPSRDNLGYDAHAVPFTGEFGRTLDHDENPKSYPLAGLIFLEQSESLKVTSIKTADAVAKLLVGCPFVNMDSEQTPMLFDSVTALALKTPLVRLQSARDETIENIMSAVKSKIYDA
jgi:hypothetical protein